MVETNPNEMEDHLTLVVASIDILTKVADLQQKAIKDAEKRHDNDDDEGESEDKPKSRSARPKKDRK